MTERPQKNTMNNQKKHRLRKAKSKAKRLAKRKARRLAKARNLARSVRRLERTLDAGAFRFPELKIPAHLLERLSAFAERIELRKRFSTFIYWDAKYFIFEAQPWLSRIAEAELLLQCERHVEREKQAAAGAIFAPDGPRKVSCFGIGKATALAAAVAKAAANNHDSTIQTF